MPSASATRILIGLAQGGAIYALLNASELKTWPATNGPLFAALLAIVICTPLATVTALTYLRPRLLLGWTLFVAAVCAATACYAILRDPVTVLAVARYAPPPEFWIALSSGLFTAHCLFVAGAIDRSRIARYPTYFDISWKFGLQAALALAFAGAFWLLLWLGAELFRLVKIDWLHNLIQKKWFWIPATTLAITCALHVTDVRVGIVRGVRTLSCTLLSWLLPLMALIVAGFLAVLPFTGLEPLWSTRRAASILLVAAASLIFLVNAAYQDGKRAADDDTEQQAMPQLLRLAMLVASAALVPLALLSAYAVALRVRQYGWTPERVIATAAVAVTACYAFGYAFAALRWRERFARLEQANVATAFVALAILVALFTPIADPARISVADQVARLNAGKIEPERFDYLFLRFNAGRYGTDALRALAEQQDLPVVAQRATAALARTARYDERPSRPPAVTITSAMRASNLAVVQPRDKALPRAFLETNWNEHRRSYLIVACLKDENVKCDAIIADLDGDGIDEVVLLRPGASRAWVFRSDTDGVWDYFNEIVNIDCDGVRNGLVTGNFSVATPIGKEIEVAGRRLRMSWPADCNLGRITSPAK